MSFPQQEFSDYCVSHNYKSAIRLIENDKCKEPCSYINFIYNLKNIEEIDSRELYDIAFLKSPINSRLAGPVYEKLTNIPTAVQSLLHIEDKHPTPNNVNSLLKRIAFYTTNEECILILAGTKYLSDLRLYKLKTPGNIIKCINILGHNVASRMDTIFKSYLCKYLDVIKDEKWDCTAIDGADPLYHIGYHSPLSMSIDRGRHDYVSSLLKIARANSNTGFTNCSFERDSCHPFIYSILKDKYKCTEVILSILGDIFESKHMKISYYDRLFKQSLELDVLEYCMMVNDIRTLELFIKAGHTTYCTKLNHINLFIFINRFDPVKRNSLWRVVREKYIQDREACGEPLSKHEQYMDHHLAKLNETTADIRGYAEDNDRRRRCLLSMKDDEEE